MTYRTDDYHKLARNRTRINTIVSLIDLACELNRLKYVERITLAGVGRDGERITTDIAAAAKTAMLDAAIASLVTSAEAIQGEAYEMFDLKKSVAS